MQLKPGELSEIAASGDVEEKQAVYEVLYNHELTMPPVNHENFRGGVGRKPEPNIVYYVRFCCRVKIGVTSNLNERLSHVPHDELLATEAGGRDLEAKRHRQFAHARLNGEWFELTPGLLSHIEAINSGHGSDIKLRLISTADAMKFTGRSRQTLYRWMKEGRVTSHGTDTKRLWDVWELPPAREDGKIPKPPPVLVPHICNPLGRMP